MSLLARGLFCLSSNNMLLAGQWAGERLERSDGAESWYGYDGRLRAQM